MSFNDQISSNIQNAKALLGSLESWAMSSENDGEKLAKMQRVIHSFNSLHESINLLVFKDKAMEKEPEEKEIKAVVMLNNKPFPSELKSNNHNEIEDSGKLSSDGKVQPINENVVVESKRSTLTVMSSNVLKTASDLYVKNQSEGGSKIKLVMTAISETILIDENITIGCYLFGKKFCDFNGGFTSRNPKTSLLLFILFHTCVPVYYLALYEIVNPRWSLLTIYFTLWILFFVILQKNFTVSKLLLKNFDTWFGIYNIFGFCISMSFLFNFDMRGVTFVLNIFNLASNFFADADIDIKDRKAQASIQLFYFLMELVCNYFALILNWYKITSLKEEIQFSYVHFTVSAYALSCLQNFLIFRFRLIFNGYMHPEVMVSLRANMVVTKVKESQAFMMLAMEKESVDSKSQNNPIEETI